MLQKSPLSYKENRGLSPISGRFAPLIALEKRSYNALFCGCGSVKASLQAKKNAVSDDRVIKYLLGGRWRSTDRPK
jgi:hypothetical protein